MEEIKLQIQDKKDLMLLWSVINNAQANSRHRLAVGSSQNEKIESEWIEETVEEWDRLMSIKVQVDNLIRG